jgi:hypothetical protein
LLVVAKWAPQGDQVISRAIVLTLTQKDHACIALAGRRFTAAGGRRTPMSSNRRFVRRRNAARRS